MAFIARLQHIDGLERLGKLVSGVTRGPVARGFAVLSVQPIRDMLVSYGERRD